MQTVAETRHYAAGAEKLLSAAERNALIDIIAADPMQGELIQGAGGIRKLRFAKEGKGKSGGVRVVYYYHDQNVPVLLLTLFGKNEKSNLSKAERNALAHVVAEIKSKLKEKRYG